MANEIEVRGMPTGKISRERKDYAFERSCGITPAEACRRAGGKVESGSATKWENDPVVQKWIAYYRSLDQTDEMLAAKRQRIEERLAMAGFANIFEFSTINPITSKPEIDWNKVAASPYGVIISGFKFDKDTGRLTDFERDSALQALAQLRDMHGFKASTKTEMTGRGGGPIEVDAWTAADRARALAALMAKIAKRETRE